MIHVFVETNWVVEVCAPAFRRTPEALALLASAERGDVSLHVPGIALREGRSVIRRKYQPKESKTLQEFRRWARDGDLLVPDVERVANDFLKLFSNTVSAELATLDHRIGEIESSSGVHVFALGDAMLQRALRLRDEVSDAELGAFDEAILGGILVRASELGTERSIFCTLDRDLSPADRHGNPRPKLKAIYDALGIDVRTSFDIS